MSTMYWVQAIWCFIWSHPKDDDREIITRGFLKLSWDGASWDSKEKSTKSHSGPSKVFVREIYLQVLVKDSERRGCDVHMGL